MDRLQYVSVSEFLLLIARCLCLLTALESCSELIVPMQPFSVLLSMKLPMDSSPTLPTPHLIMILVPWLLMPVTLGLFWTSP